MKFGMVRALGKKPSLAWPARQGGCPNVSCSAES
jgi:hypothetical protein